MLYSFDIFDTLITRRTATPEGIFTLMQERLEAGEIPQVPDSLRDNFCELRIHASELAHHNGCIQGIEEVSLERIYEALALQCGLGFEEQNALAALEREIEKENILGIRQNIIKVEALLSERKRVILISDMYLDSDTVKEMLRSVSKDLAKLPLYLSSDYGKGKWTGSLFRIVKEKETVDFCNWIHCGDNLRSDVEIPTSLGIRTDYFSGSAYRDIEKKLLKVNKRSVYIQRSLGVVRSLLAQEPVSVARRIGISQGGPILYAYVWWMLNECCQQNIRRLYFIARDGYILKRIAEIVVRQYHYDIELYYLYGSRKAWRTAGFRSGIGRVYELIRWSHTFDIHTPSDLAEVFQIDVDELLPWLPANINRESVLLQEALYVLANHLDAKTEFQEFLVEKYRLKRKMVQDYLKQEIALDDTNYAFADLAGGGYTQSCLADMMQEVGYSPVKSFYFKMDSIRREENCSYQVFLPCYLKSNLIIEMFGRACHGQTSAYKRDGEQIVPVLEKVEEKVLNQLGIQEYLSGVETYAEYFTECIIKDRRRGDDIASVLAYFDYVAVTPDKETVDFWGGMPSGVTGRERRVEEYAPIITDRMAWKIYFAHDRLHEPLQQFYHGSDPAYSVIRSPAGVRKRIQYYQENYDSLLGKLVRSFTHPHRSRQAGKIGLYRDFPIELLSGRIVLYGCGKFGQYLFQQIKRYGEENCRVVLWVDGFPRRMEEENIEVAEPEKIACIDYDIIIISVLRAEAAKQIRDRLLKQGVTDSQILWVDMWGDINNLWQ